MGLLDLPAPLFGLIDQQLAGLLPAAARLTLWAAFTAAASMTIYQALSPQGRIARTKAAAREGRRALNTYEGALEGAWPLAGQVLRLSVRQLMLTLPATLIASVPVLCVIVWLSTAYGYAYPEEEQAVDVETRSPGYTARWQADQSGPRIEITDVLGRSVVDFEVSAPVTTVHKRQWWNVFLGNPAGYLPADAPMNRVEIALPREEILPFGPAWLRSWEPLFFTALIASSLAVKFTRRIE